MVPELDVSPGSQYSIPRLFSSRPDSIAQLAEFQLRLIDVAIR